VLERKALASLTWAVEAFNSPHNDGRVTRVLLHLQHASKCAKIKLNEADAGTLRAIDAMRNDEQHWFNQVSEQLLYLHAPAGITLFDDLLQRVFTERLTTHLPTRVLPLSVERELGPKPSRRPLDYTREDSIGRPLLNLLSQRVVAAEVANNPDPFLKPGSTGALRSTWKSHSDFVADVLRFGLWSQHYLGAHAEHIAEATEQLVEGADFIHAVHAVCYYHLLTLIGMTGFRLELLATASAEGDKVLNDAMAAARSCCWACLSARRTPTRWDTDRRSLPILCKAPPTPPCARSTAR
jgi:hypothetical protein